MAASGSRATAAYVVFAVNNDDLSPTVYENLLGDDQVARRGSFGSGRFEDRSSGRAKVEFSWTRDDTYVTIRKCKPRSG